MHHVWQHVFGTPSKRGYHNREWAAKMKSNGLQPSSTGMVGGKETGQRMSDYPIPNGRFLNAFADLEATGWKLDLQSAHHGGGPKAPSSKIKVTCPNCETTSAWGKPALQIVCKTCLVKALVALPWLDEGKANDLGEIVDGTTMRPPAESGVVSSHNGTSNLAARCGLPRP
jgi:hypothetical protein